MTKKRLFFSALTLFLLCSCAAGAAAPETPKISMTPSVPTDETMSPVGPGDGPVDEPPWVKMFRLAAGADTGELLLSSDDGGLYTLSANRLEDVPPLADGMLLNVYFDGILETYPAQFQNPTAIEPITPPDDRCGLYLQALEDLWNTGANGEALTYLGVDLSRLDHLDPGEKAAVAWRFAQNHGLTLLTGTLEELAQQGFFTLETVSTETLEGDEPTETVHLERWEDGIFFRLETDREAVWSTPTYYEVNGEELPARTAFYASKQRFGAPQVWACCASRDQDGSWSYALVENWEALGIREEK